MSNKKILVIEDDELNMKLIRIVLDLGGYRILEAPDAEEGIKMIRSEMPDLILMDIQLPGIDGFKATRVIKEDEALKSIPVIALTAFAMHGDDRKAMEAGCDGYITKPIDTRKLIQQLEGYIKG